MRPTFRIAATVVAIGLALIVPFVVAGPKLFPTAHTELQRQWQDLFTTVFWAALIVFVLVEGLLVYALFRFRKRADGPQEGPHIHGNTKMEIAWTIAPTIVMAWLLVVSLNQLEVTDNPPEPDFWVEVTGSQFTWTFAYPPDYTETNAEVLRVEEGSRVGLRVMSTDVIHAFNVPELGVMIDAVPGRQNHFWFIAPAPGNYSAQCRELCGAGHGTMHATVEVFAAGSQNRSWGAAVPPTSAPAPTSTPPSNNTTLPAADVTQEVLLEGPPTFRIVPPTLTAEPGQSLLLKVQNVASMPHNLYIGNYQTREILNNTRDLKGGESEDLFIQLPEEEGAWEWWCDVTGHYGAGMRGVLSTGGTLPGGKTPLLPGPGAALIVLGLVGALVWARRRSA